MESRIDWGPVQDDLDMQQVEEEIRNIWGAKWRPKFYTRCSYCGQDGDCISNMLEGTAKCSRCYASDRLLKIRAERDAKKQTDKLDVKDFARLG